MASRFQFRRANASAWTAANPTLAAGELGFELDTKNFKIGDGVTAWNSLSYTLVEGLTGVIAESIVDEKGDLIVGTANNTLSRLAAGTVGYVLTVDPSEPTGLKWTQASNSAGTETLTNKTLNFGSNTITGTISEFNTALSDQDFATLAGTETLSNKTLVNPNIGNATGTNLNVSGTVSATALGSSLLSSVVPNSISGTASVGTAVVPSRQDHQHGTAGLVTVSDIGNTVASLSGGKIPSNQLPSIAITDVFVVSSQSAMLALTAETGDVAIRTDTNQSFILSSNNPSTLADWKELKVNTNEYATLTGTQTLTNKTLTTPLLTLGTASGTTDGFIYWNSIEKEIKVGNGTAALTFAPNSVASFASIIKWGND